MSSVEEKFHTAGPALGCLGIILLLGFTACETSFEPFAESDVHFTLLGFLDTDADTQFVRVIPLRPVVDRLYNPEIDAALRSIDLTEGVTSVWADSIVRFPDSTYGHVFWSDFRAIPEHEYRIEVERSDGATAWAQTKVPRPGNPEDVYGALNETADFAPLFWPGVQEVIEADVLYDITPYGCFEHARTSDKASGTFVYRIPYTGTKKGELTNENEWRIELKLWDDRDTLMARLGVRDPFCANLHRLEVRLATPSAEFHPPGGVWDREVLIQPGTISNVTGGFGFVGSVARTTVDWKLKPVTQNALRYSQE